MQLARALEQTGDTLVNQSCANMNGMSRTKGNLVRLTDPPCPMTGGTVEFAICS